MKVLFAGGDPEGKAQAAKTLADTLRTKLLRVDLDRISSKYVGETEKHLSTLFDEAERSNVLLFFDEADALFGKRDDAKDSPDRYANIDLEFLLKRIEEFSGIAIVSTNLRENIDRAFVRRFRYVVTF